MPTSIWASSRTPGFTLVEMLVVLTILGLAAALLAGRMGDRPGRFARERSVAELEARIAAARRQAVAGATPVRLDPGALDEAATLQGQTFGRSGVLTFFPDGSASGGIILLDGVPAIEVDWLSGAAVRAP